MRRRPSRCFPIRGSISAGSTGSALGDFILHDNGLATPKRGFIAIDTNRAGEMWPDLIVDAARAHAIRLATLKRSSGSVFELQGGTKMGSLCWVEELRGEKEIPTPRTIANKGVVLWAAAQAGGVPLLWGANVVKAVRTIAILKSRLLSRRVRFPIDSARMHRGRLRINAWGCAC